jgi:colicin import membrane protein
MSEEESSVLFSLKELMSIEEDRIKQEEHEQTRARQEAEQARQEAERRAQEAEEARRRAEDQRRMQDEQRQREEATRLDAIRHGEIEKARAEHEQKARLEAMASQQAHERQLAELNQDKGKTRLRNWLIAGSIATVMILGGGGFYFYRYQQEQDRMQAANEAERKRLEEESARKEKELQTKLAEINELQDKLGRAVDPEEIERLRKKLAEAKDEAGSLKPGSGYRPPGKLPDKGIPEPKTCQPGDPLCSDL